MSIQGTPLPQPPRPRSSEHEVPALTVPTIREGAAPQAGPISMPRHSHPPQPLRRGVLRQRQRLLQPDTAPSAAKPGGSQVLWVRECCRPAHAHPERPGHAARAALAQLRLNLCPGGLSPATTSPAEHHNRQREHSRAAKRPSPGLK